MKKRLNNLYQRAMSKQSRMQKQAGPEAKNSEETVKKDQATTTAEKKEDEQASRKSEDSSAKSE